MGYMVIAATNKDIYSLVRKESSGKTYFRINILNLHVPHFRND